MEVYSILERTEHRIIAAQVRYRHLDGYFRVTYDEYSLDPVVQVYVDDVKTPTWEIVTGEDRHTIINLLEDN